MNGEESESGDKIFFMNIIFIHKSEVRAVERMRKGKKRHLETG